MSITTDLVFDEERDAWVLNRPAHTPIKDLLSVEEKTLFEGSTFDWGNAEVRAARGAAFLDREMPGWENQVRINSLDMSAGCKCVLGQLFSEEVLPMMEGGSEKPVFVDGETEPRLPYARWLAEGYGFGLWNFGLSWRDGHNRMADTAASFLGFDLDAHAHVTYDELTRAWAPLIEARRAKAEATS